MRTNTPFKTREEWLNVASILLLDELGGVCSIRADLDVKISVGFAPNTKTNSRVRGVCFSRAASESRLNEIYISPVINDTLDVLAVLLHELIHAIDDCVSGHQGEFSKRSRAMGFLPPLTSSRPNAQLLEKLQAVKTAIGDFPHAKIAMHGFKQESRSLKCVCADCDFRFQASITQIARAMRANHDALPCLVCFKPMRVLRKQQVLGIAEIYGES